MLKTFKLSNGIQVATYNLPNLRSVHLRVIAKGGSLAEDKTQNGVAHFMEHMLVQGTPSLPNAEEFSGFIESLAGNYSAYTERLLIGFNITIPATHIEDALRIGSEVFFEPLFMELAMGKERRAIVEELKQNMDSHWYKISQYFRKSRFVKNHVLTLDPGGTLDIVQKLTREDLINFWKKCFIPQNTYLLISGKFNEGQLNKLLNHYFDKIGSSDKKNCFPPLGAEGFSPRGVNIRSDMKLGANYIDLTIPSIDLNSNLSQRITQNLALVILGGIRNSRLFKLLRYQKGLVYSVHSGSSVLPGLGYVYLTSEATPSHLEEVVSLMVSELTAFVKNGPTSEELKLVKNYLTNQWLMTFDHPSAIAGWIENDLMWNNKVRLPEEYIEILEGITASDITKLMQTEWDFAKLNLTLQGPIKNVKEVKHKFEMILEKLS